MITSEHALIEVALIEQPPGAEFINHQLWQHTDEMIVELERRSALEHNGFRVGQLVGASPVGFQHLLLSKRCNSNPELMIFASSSTKTIYLTPSTLPQTAYQFFAGDKHTALAFDQARFGLDVAARFAPDGRTTFTFTPKVEHGELALPFHAVPEQSTWEMKLERATQRHPELKWEVTLGPNQYLIVGARPEREGSLGQTAFVLQDGINAVQRVLVIRNCRSANAREVRENDVVELLRQDRTPPLALQATVPAQRGKSR